MGERLKLSEASKLCGISVRTLKVLIADGLLAVERTPQGQPLIADDAVTTWSDCRALLVQQRDRHLQKAAKLLERVEVELEAVRNDIAEAREHPAEPLGVDFTAFSLYAASGQTTLGAALTQFERARIDTQLYRRALAEVVEADRP
ncbi:DNA-binding protein [Mycolicibacterium bacteremicum]|uniref:DNA-binding protein n=1 Tax=Mycolicibacterium bacteremicum TaxID=564198 RepID=UPI0026F2CC17|nr:DNA-binding protein [Mycolicibacterium bacteremicum]